VRQVLADKVSGTMVGLWLLLAEHLRLGTWDLLCGWTGCSGERVEPRLALQLVHEAALCVSGIRQARCLVHKGFELANGLPFVATDQAIHRLLAERSVQESRRLQIALGRIRRASGHYQGTLLAVDPHRMRSYSTRQMPYRRSQQDSQAFKSAQTFFCLDVETKQPLAFTTASAARTVTQALPELLELVTEILRPQHGSSLLLADTEHYTAELFEHVRNSTPFELLTPMPNQAGLRRLMQSIACEQFIPRWSGFATTTVPFHFNHNSESTFYQLVQRSGEAPDQFRFKGFLCTGERDELEALTSDYPKRWHVEEFFNANQALGWQRAGTLNLNIRFAQMTMALIAQAAISQLRQRLAEPFQGWEASHLAHQLFQGLDGDLRVHRDTIVVTYYNAPNTEILRTHYQHLPEQLTRQHIDPRIPWLYNFKLDFRFK
jgi:hypothetical protein